MKKTNNSAEEARKDREERADKLYSGILDRSEYLEEQAEILYLISANKEMDLPEKLDITFAEMQDKAKQIHDLAGKLFEIVTEKAEQ